VQGAHIWIYDRTGTTAPRQLTIGGANRFPVWSPDGQWIAYQSDREGDLAIFRQRTDGTDSPERISKPEKGVAHIPESWSSDGETLSFTEAKGNDAALWTFSFKEKKASLFAGTPPTAQGLSLRFVGRSAFSPDGRWLGAAFSRHAGKVSCHRGNPPVLVGRRQRASVS
jgi:tricorn protease